MSDPSTSQLVNSALQLVPGLLWAITARGHWQVLRTRRPRSTLFGLLFAVTALAAVHYFLFAFCALVPGLLSRPGSQLRGVVGALIDVDGVALIASGRHLARIWPVQAGPPGRSWLLGNYVTAGLVGVVAVPVDLNVLPAGVAWGSVLFVVYTVYLIAMAVLTVHDLRRLLWQGGRRRRGIGDARLSDGVFTAVGFVGTIGSHLVALAFGTRGYFVLMGGGPPAAAAWMYGLHAAGGTLLTFPFVVRDLPDVSATFVTVVAMITATWAAYTGVPALSARLPDADLQRLVSVSAVLGLVALITLGRPRLRALVERVLFGLRRRLWEELQGALGTLTPELGTRECCRRALAELARCFQLRGAAILLRDGEAVV